MRITEVLRRLMLLFRRDRATAELEEEMRLHRELRADALRDGGVIDADQAARRQFGNPLAIQEASRDAWGLSSLEDVGQDVRYALRRLRQRPGFTAAVVGVLALGIGATTAMFSAVDAAMLRPLPFARPQELVALPEVSMPFDPGPSQSPTKSRNHYLDATDITAMHGQFSHVAAWASGGLTLSDPEHPRRLTAGVVTADFFNTLGISAVEGRAFIAEEGKPAGPRVVLLSYALWQDQFGGKEMLQHTILLNNKAYLVVGIMPRGFSFPMESDIWIPMSMPTTFATFEAFRGFLPSEVIARLAPGVSVDIASNQVIAQWQRGLSDSSAAGNSALPIIISDRRQHGGAVPLQQNLLGDRRTAMVVLLGATGLLLLIVCVNVTNLLLSQAVVRRREMAVRSVLGATRRRVVRQLLTESVMLALAGTVLGVAIAPASLGFLRTLMPAALATIAPVQLDLRVLAFAALIGLTTGIVFGLWPALGATETELGTTIKSGGGHGSTTRGASRIRRGLVAGELALTLILLVGAGLMLRSLHQLMAMDRGMNVEHVGTLEMSFPRANGMRATTLGVISPILERLETTPGITSAGAVNDLPLGTGGGIAVDVIVDGAPAVTGDDRPGARLLMASGDYFKAMGIPLIAGRSFIPADDTLAPKVAVISAGMAKAFWPGGSALGKTFHAFGPQVTVVGIVADVREITLDRDPMPQMYFSIYAETSPSVALVARGTLSPQALLAAMRSAVHALDPSQAVYHVRTMDEVLSASVAPRRTNTVLISLFAALALMLASLGVYAVVAHGVAQRAREFGIRTALGATGTDLLSLISREMLWVTGLGFVGGLGGAWLLGRVAESLLFGVTAHDTMTFVAVPAVLLLPVLLATLVPARRALRVNPAEVMRAD